LSIVIVDDEPDTVLTLLEILRAHGYRAEGYSSSAAGLAAIAKSDPDVIISDIAMPSPNGWELAKQVRANKGDTRRPMMIAISGHYIKSADRMLAQLSGFDHYVTKPCDPQALIELIEKARGS
jgi:CheY-like chemotaxis protein